MSFLEKGQQLAWIRDPSLKTLPQKRKERAPATPEPIDELSSKTRETIVSKLRRRVAIYIYTSIRLLWQEQQYQLYVTL